jgi:hypothetical protein
VWPVGEPQKAAFGVLTIMSTNHRSVAVQFEDIPGFVQTPLNLGGEIGNDANNVTVTILLLRESDEGPWTDIASGQQYELEQ